MYTEAHKAIREDPNKEDPDKDTSKTKEEWKASPHPIPPSHNISTKSLKLTSPTGRRQEDPQAEAHEGREGSAYQGEGKSSPPPLHSFAVRIGTQANNCTDPGGLVSEARQTQNPEPRRQKNHAEVPMKMMDSMVKPLNGVVLQQALWCSVSCRHTADTRQPVLLHDKCKDEMSSPIPIHILFVPLL